MGTVRIKFNNDHGDMARLLRGYTGAVDVPADAMLWEPGTISPDIWAMLYGVGSWADIPMEEMPANLGTNMIHTETKTDIWPRKLTHLQDVKPLTTTDLGKSLIVDPTQGYLFVFGFPSQLAEARTITLESTEGYIDTVSAEFDGSGDISFDVTVLKADTANDPAALHATENLGDLDDVAAALENLGIDHIADLFASPTAGDTVIRKLRDIYAAEDMPGVYDNAVGTTTGARVIVGGTVRVKCTAVSTGTVSMTLRVNGNAVDTITDGAYSHDIAVAVGDVITLQCAVDTPQTSADLTDIQICTAEGSPLVISVND